MKIPDINVLYEDNHIIVVEKGIGILSQADNTGDDDLVNIVKSYIKEKYDKPGNVYLGLVHRLDKMVGGIMVFAKTSKAASRLSDSIRKNEINKYYMAIVHGKLEGKNRLINNIKKLDNGNSVISPDGKEAILDYEAISYNKEKNCSLVKIHLLTGRHHQIRVQFANIGHAILGDHRYSFGEEDYPIALYAYKLEFVHPVKKEEMSFQLLPKNYGFWKLFDVNKIL